MAKIPFSAKKHDINTLNSGYQYTTDDQMSIEALNNTIENSFYASNIAENVSQQLSNLDPNEKIEFKGSNPNLLINGDFRVNQRGLGEYSPKTSWGDYTYTCDRWALYGLATAKFSVTTKRLTGQTWFLQTIDDFEGLLGKTLTFSMKFNQLSNDYINFTFRKVFTDETKESIDKRFYPSIGNQTIQYTFDLPADNEKTIKRVELIIYQGANGDIEIDYIKLEIGSIATPYSPRPYAEELALCQRYYQLLGGRGWGYGTGTEKTGNFGIPIPVTFRTAPTIYIGNNLYIRGESGNYQASSVTYLGYSSNNLDIICVADNIVNNKVFVISHGSIKADAEMY